MKIKNDIASCRTCIYRTLLFGCLSDIEYKLVNNARKEYYFSKGETIKAEGLKVDSFLYLRKGLVKLFKTDHTGKDHILSINKPGDFINLLHIFSNETYTYNIVAIEDTLVCDVELAILRHLLKTNGDFAMTIASSMGKIADETIAYRFDQAQKQIKGRVASILLFFSDDVYHTTKFDLPITRREIGELIAMTTENTIRTLSIFHHDGIIAVDGKTIEILKYDLLKTIRENG